MALEAGEAPELSLGAREAPGPSPWAESSPESLAGAASTPAPATLSGRTLEPAPASPPGASPEPSHLHPPTHEQARPLLPARKHPQSAPEADAAMPGRRLGSFGYAWAVGGCGTRRRERWLGRLCCTLASDRPERVRPLAGASRAIRALACQPFGGLLHTSIVSLLPPTLFNGLEEHSHAWIVFVFHANTDLGRLWSEDPDKGVRGKVRVPRLDGARRGTLATRSPHRPNPLGLTLARVLRVRGTEVVFGGCDLVDGTPVLDVKPYADFCDNPKRHEGGDAAFFSPPWVVPEVPDPPQPEQGAQRKGPRSEAGDEDETSAHAARATGETGDAGESKGEQRPWDLGTEEPRGAGDAPPAPSSAPPSRKSRAFEPLRIARLERTRAAERALRAAWVERSRRGSSGEGAPLTTSADAFVSLVASVLSRDVRSVANRVGAPKRAQAQGGADLLALGQTSGGAGGRQGGGGSGGGGKWHVVLDGIDVDYDVDEADVVRIRGAEVWTRLDE